MNRRAGLSAVVVAGALVLVVGLGVWTMVGSPSSSEGVCGLFGEEADAIIYWATDDGPELAVDEDQRSLQAELSAVRGVDEVEAMDPAQTWDHMVAAAEAVGAGVAQGSVPPGFPASIAVLFSDAGWSDVERLQEELTDAPWTRAVLARDEPGASFHEVVPDRWGRVDLVVFLEPGSPSDSLELIASDLATTDGVEEVEVFSQEQAFDEFAEMFADSPELVATVTPDLLPASIRVAMDEPDDIDRTESVAESVRGGSDVREVALSVSSTLFTVPFLTEFADGC